MRRALVLVLIAALAACAPGDAATDRPAAAAFRPLSVGDTVPAYAAQVIGGDSVRIGPGAMPGLTLVNVWATWCATCKEEFADVEAITKDFRPRGLSVIAVSVDRGGAERVARFARAQGATFTVAHDPAGLVQKKLRLVGVPETLLVSADGRVLWRYQGALPPGAAEARREIERALAARS